MSDPYVYRGTDVLKNKFGIRNADELERAERKVVSQRIAEGVPAGDFDLKHLQAIHRHLFQDVYDWAGKIRSVNISKGGHLFLPPSRIVDGMHHVHVRIVQDRYLRGLAFDQFAVAAADIMADVNYVHPFREGNGRTQLQYLKRLAERAGHAIDLSRLGGTGWIDASKAAHDRELDLMADQIRMALLPGTEQPGSDRDG